jgi:PAP2 superfamily
MPTLWHDMNWVLPLRHEVLTHVFGAFTNFGTVTAYIFLLLVMAWLWQPLFVNRLLPWVGVSTIINNWAKDYFHDPRPDVALQIPGHSAAGFGLPSGHAQLAIFFWGAVAIHLHRTNAPRPCWLGAMLIALMICLSRLYLAVHDVQDVTVGALIGCALLFLFERVSGRFVPAPLPVIIGFALFALLALLAWPGGGGGQIVVPAMALVTSWFGVQILTGPPLVLPGTRVHRLWFALMGLLLVILLATMLRQALPETFYRPLLLASVGLLGISWPHVLRRCYA